MYRCSDQGGGCYENICKYLRLIILFAIWSSLILKPSIIFGNEVNTLRAIQIDDAIRLNGFLDEPVWQSIPALSDFTQRELQEGAKPTEKTQVRVAYDGNNLYIGVICYDSEPEKIRNNELTWDGNLREDDHFSLMLDTFNDQRTGYLFTVNPNGARADGLIKNKEIEDLNTDWDGIWDVEAQILDNGWSAEILIPFRSLQFPDVAVQTWGINFSRVIRRKNEEVLWTAWNRNDGILQLSRAGKLTGLENIERGKQVELMPFALGGGEKEPGSKADDTFNYGFDMKYPVTSDFTLNLTTNTDFAQIESDKEQLNMTQFNLQYPEKRDFFLEGAEIFDFTQGGTKMYYSRRIGITPDPDRQELPILGGMKLSGKSGAYQLGVMSMQTNQKSIMRADGTRITHPSANYSVVRIKRDVLKESYIGLIGTSVYRGETPNHPLTGIGDTDRFMNKKDNFMAGFDFGFKTSKFLKTRNLSVLGYFAASRTPELQGDGYAGRVYLEYSSDISNSYLLYHAIDENFNPEIGFVTRPGIQQYIAHFEYNPRVNLPFIKKFLFEPAEMNYMTDSRRKLLSSRLEIRPFGILFESDDRLEVNIHRHYDYPEWDFNIFKNVVIPVGGYEYWHYYVNYFSSGSKRAGFDLTFTQGNFYNGTRIRYEAAGNFKLNKHLSLTPELSYYDVTLPYDRFIARQLAIRAITNISTRLNAGTFVQWTNQSNQANLYFRIHYIPKTGSDIYLVYNQLWDEEDNFRTLRNTALLKVNYLFRF